MIFENPSAFLFLLAVPAFYILRHYKIFSKISFPLTFSDWKGKSFSWKGGGVSFFTFFARVFAWLAFVSLVFALANPVVRQKEKIYTSRGADILFVLDTSPSMASRDIQLANTTLTRFDAAKAGIRTLIESESGANYGLVAMASEAAAVIPPTQNHAIFFKRMEELKIGAMGESSALGTGISTAVYHLASSNAPKKCIVLITDGENNAGKIHPETAAELASQNGITLYSLGIGTKGTVPIEYSDPKTGEFRSGLYESGFDSGELETIAAAAGGKYFGIENMADLASSFSEIARKENAAQSFYFKNVDRDCYRNFLLLAFIFAALSWFIKRLILKEA